MHKNANGNNNKLCIDKIRILYVSILYVRDIVVQYAEKSYFLTNLGKQYASLFTWLISSRYYKILNKMFNLRYIKISSWHAEQKYYKNITKFQLNKLIRTFAIYMCIWVLYCNFIFKNKCTNFIVIPKIDGTF